MNVRNFRLPSGKILSTPQIFLTYTNVEYGMQLYPWRYMKVPGLLFPLNSVYPLIENGTINEPLKEFLELEEETVTFVDCKLRFTPHKKRFYRATVDTKLKSLLIGSKIEEIDIDKIVKVISVLEPDIVSVPYYSIKFDDSISEVKRISDANHKILKAFLDKVDEIGKSYPIPVIQVGISEKVEEKVELIIKTLNDMGLTRYIYLAYGGHVDFPYKPVKQVLLDFINIRRIRQTVKENYFLHIFGIGSYSLVPCCIHLGADSVDSTLWSAKAGRKEIIVPGIGARSLRGRKDKRQFLSEEESKIPCNCPICQGRTVGEMKEIFLNDVVAGRIHNAWVQIKDIEVIIKAIKRRELFTLCQNRVKVKNLLEVLNTVRLDKFM